MSHSETKIDLFILFVGVQILAYPWFTKQLLVEIYSEAFLKRVSSCDFDKFKSFRLHDLQTVCIFDGMATKEKC
jgi:hypothetical protein